MEVDTTEIRITYLISCINITIFDVTNSEIPTIDRIPYTTIKDTKTTFIAVKESFKLIICVFIVLCFKFLIMVQR